jgi:hypothetical protein
MKVLRTIGQMMGSKWVAMVGGGVLLVTGCTSYEGAPAYVPATAESTGGALRSGDSAMPWNSPDAAMAEPGASSSRHSPPPESRPGLGTGWGDRVSSEMGYTGFVRGSSKPYGGVAAIYYNDKEGGAAMTSWKYSGRGMQTAANGLVEWGVKGSFGSLKNYHSDNRRFVVGRQGQRYSLVVKNLAKSRLEVVLSVDGLDVLDGKTAGMKKRGYIIAPGKTLQVKGWRTSSSSVASFEFSSVAGSYANLGSGETRNVGVIGMAVFTEKGVSPFAWMPDEVRRREAASPFAEPPMRRAR